MRPAAPAPREGPREARPRQAERFPGPPQGTVTQALHSTAGRSQGLTTRPRHHAGQRCLRNTTPWTAASVGGEGSGRKTNTPRQKEAGGRCWRETGGGQNRLQGAAPSTGCPTAPGQAAPGPFRLGLAQSLGRGSVRGRMPPPEGPSCLQTPPQPGLPPQALLSTPRHCPCAGPASLHGSPRTLHLLTHSFKQLLGSSRMLQALLTGRDRCLWPGSTATHPVSRTPHPLPP